MNQRPLGRTGLMVSEIGFGAMELRGPRIWDGRPVSPSEAERILNAVLEAGINFIDTAPDYGLSEEYIGRFLSTRRDEYVLATKCGCYLVDKGNCDETRHVWTRGNLLRNIDKSLRRLKTDHVDILQLHNPTVKDVLNNDIIDVLQEIKDSGRTRFIGVSSTWPDLLEFIEMGVFDTIQTTYSALDHTHEDLISFAAEKGIGSIVRGGLVKGALTDLESHNLIENIRRTVGKRELWRESRLEEVLGEMQPMEFLLRFALTHPDVGTVIVGTLNSDHLKENLSAARKGPLPDWLYVEAKRRLSRCGVRPVWKKEGGSEVMNPTNELIRQTDRYRAKNYQPLPVIVSKAKGVWVEDCEGRKYLDMISAYGALNQGHCHPKIVEALKRQADRAALLSDAFYNDQQGLLYQRLSRLTKKDLVFLANSGVEAVEAALKVARRWGYRVKGVPKHRAEIIICDRNFHGRTITVISFSTDECIKADFGPYTPGFKSIPFGNVEALREAITPNTVAFLVEPVQGRGIRVPPRGFLHDALEVCRQNRVLFLADEVQTGFGRTGKSFCSDWEEVTPDIYIMGKALGGGVYPVAAVAADAEIFDVLEPGSHGTTYGANPLACAVALAALDVVEQENLPQRSCELGEYFAHDLRKLRGSAIKEVRGRGLFIGVELTGPVKTYCERLRHQGILCKGGGMNTIRLVPPLVITRDELDWALERLKRVFAQESQSFA